MDGSENAAINNHGFDGPKSLRTRIKTNRNHLSKRFRLDEKIEFLLKLLYKQTF